MLELKQDLPVSVVSLLFVAIQRSNLTPWMKWDKIKYHKTQEHQHNHPENYIEGHELCMYKAISFCQSISIGQANEHLIV